MKMTYWIYYPGDFEIYHGMLQSFSREERGFFWPAYYKIDDCRRHVKFTRTYQLTDKTSFIVHSNVLGYLRVNDEKRRFNEEIQCEKGKNYIEIFAGAPTGVPSVFIEGELIYSDKDWKVDDFVSSPVTVGYSRIYTKKEQNPSIWVYDSREVKPSIMTEIEGGTLYDFETELTATLKVQFLNGFKKIMICYGESVAEAINIDECYYSQSLLSEKDAIGRRAFRYLYLPEVLPGEVEITAVDLFNNYPSKADFHSNEEEFNKIWEVAERTFKLCAGAFFIDGVKRDKWIWSGDAYQSYYVNQYLLFDEEISKRTIWALRGNDPLKQHINTIVDYSMYWVLSVYNHYQMTGDIEFVRAIYPKMKTMMEFLEIQLDEHGFIIGREGDWIFIDWSEMDKEGALCAEQMLLAMCYKTMHICGKIMDDHETADYKDKYQQLLENIDSYYWDKEKHAYIDTFASGKRHVTRHGNIFAILYHFVDSKRAQEIYEHVLLNPEITEIVTPYFKFYEMEVLCQMGKLKEVKDRISAYWGGMLKLGAVTFWEEYDPKKEDTSHYEMYGDPFGKSLCHAWAASPIYLIGRYFMGIRQTDVAYGSYIVEPDTALFRECSCRFPLKDGEVILRYDRNVMKVMATREGGILKYHNAEYILEKNKEICVALGHNNI